MWHVFLWLNICSITVVCQRGYIPHHSYFIESLLYPRKCPAAEEARPAPQARGFSSYDRPPRYRDTFPNGSFYNPPYLQFCPPPKKSNPPAPLNSGYLTSRKSRGSQNPILSQPQTYILNTPETYILLKNIPPIRIESNKHKPVYNSPVTTYSYLYEKRKSNYGNCVTDHFIKLSLTPKSNVVPLGAKTVNLILPSPIIINNLGVWPSRPPGRSAVGENATTMCYNLDQHIINIVHDQPASERVNDDFNIKHVGLKKKMIDVQCTTGSLKNEILSSVTNRSTENYEEYESTECEKYSTSPVTKVFADGEVDGDRMEVCLAEENATLCSGLGTTTVKPEDEEIMSLIESIKAVYEGRYTKKVTTRSTTREVLFDEDLEDLCYNGEVQESVSSAEEFYGEETEDVLTTACGLRPEEEEEEEHLSSFKSSRDNDGRSPSKNYTKICEDCHPHHKYMLDLLRGKQPAIGLNRRKFSNGNVVRCKRKTKPWEVMRKRRKMKRENGSNEQGSTTEEVRRGRRRGGLGVVEGRCWRRLPWRYRTFPIVRWNVLRNLAGKILIDDQGRAIEVLDENSDSAFVPKINRKRAFVSAGIGPKIINKNRASVPSVITPTTEGIIKKKTFHEKNWETTMPKEVVEVAPSTEAEVTLPPPSSTTRRRAQRHTRPTETTSTVHALLVPDTGNRHPSKLACEEATHMECICCIETAIADLNEIASAGRDLAAITDGVVSYECSDYRPLNASFVLSSNLKPRLITKKSKELIVDDKAGPKEVMKDTFIDLLYRGIPNEGIDFYIFPSTSVRIPCFTSDDIQLSPNTADLAVYQWRHGNERPITEGRAVEDANHKGMLQISDAIGTDSDTYKCTVTYRNPDTEEVITSTFIHSLFVVQLPKIVLQTPLHYRARVRCDQETLEMFELYLPQQVEELVCYCQNDTRRACVVEIHNPLCQGKTYKVKKRRNPKRIWHFDKSRPFYDNETSEELSAKMEMSMDYQVALTDVSEVIDAAVNKTHCNPFCQLKMLLKMVDIIRDSLVISLSHPVSASTGVSFQPDVDTLDVKMLIGCEGGLQLYQGFCIPCPVNTYSEEGSTECSPCPPGYHQPHIGSKRCERCVTPFQSGCSASWGTPLWLFLAILTIVVIIVILILLIKKIHRRKKKEKKKYVTTDSTRSTRSSTFKRGRQKRQKSVHYTDTSEEVPAPSLPSEDFTG